MSAKIVFVSTIPPTQCGIATFTFDLVTALEKTFNLQCDICEITGTSEHMLKSAYSLDSTNKEAYKTVAHEINNDKDVALVHIQHEFGLFGGDYGDYLLKFLDQLTKPIAITFHSVVPSPDSSLKSLVELITSYAKIVFTMTRDSKDILIKDYGIEESMIYYIPHGTHAVTYAETHEIKKNLGFENHTLLSTFGLLGSGKSIETALKALPEIINEYPDILYLVIGKSHPKSFKKGEDYYRNYLNSMVKEKKLEDHVIFIDRYLELNELLDFLKATDIYLFTSKNPSQAVSGTFAYAMSCACPIVATSIPHTREELTPDTGIIFNIEDDKGLSMAVKKLLSNKTMRESMGINAFQKTLESSWENVAIKHLIAYTEKQYAFSDIKFKLPQIKLKHIKRLTTPNGIVQFSKINIPDLNSGFTLDDNARALIAMCMHYLLSGKKEDLYYIDIYLSFVERSQKSTGTFVNYFDKNNKEHIKNSYVNLEDSNARAIWALGVLISLKEDIPENMIDRALNMFMKTLDWVQHLLSPRAIGFSIKGLYAYYESTKDVSVLPIIETLAENLMTKYDLNAVKNWKWFEEYMTYANGILPEAMLYAYLATNTIAYKKVAQESLEFLLSKMFVAGDFKVISNDGWYHKNQTPNQFGEQPIDVTYTIQALYVFYKVFGNQEYKSKMEIAFRWFIGKNHLNQMLYNPSTGGCHDGLEEHNVNLNQGAESTICYLIARLIMEELRMEKYERSSEIRPQLPKTIYPRSRKRTVYQSPDNQS